MAERPFRVGEARGSNPLIPTGGWVAQCGRASVSYSEGSGFDPRPNLLRAISSAEERLPHTQEVGGSIPLLPTRGSVAQADQSSRLLTGRLEVRVLSDPLRPVAQGKEQEFPNLCAAVRVCPGLLLVEGRACFHSMGHWSRGSGRPLLRWEVEGSSPSCPTLHRRSSASLRLAEWCKGSTAYSECAGPGSIPGSAA